MGGIHTSEFGNQNLYQQLHLLSLQVFFRVPPALLQEVLRQVFAWHFLCFEAENVLAGILQQCRLVYAKFLLLFQLY